MAVHQYRNCGCNKNRLAHILNSAKRNGRVGKISKANRMTVPAPFALSMPKDSSAYLGPTQIANGVFSINATLFMGSPGMLSLNGPITDDEQPIFSAYITLS
jgi:hypothetical protein